MFFSQRINCGKSLDHLNKTGLSLWNRPPNKALNVFQAVKEKPRLPLCRLAEGSRSSSSSSLTDPMHFVLNATMGMLLPWPGVKPMSRVADCWDYSRWCWTVNPSTGRSSLCITGDSTEEFLFTQSFQLNIPQLWAFVGNLSDHRLSCVQLTKGVSGAKLTNMPR